MERLRVDLRRGPVREPGLLVTETIEILRRRLPLPPLLDELIASGRWDHPGDDVLLDKVPFIHDPLIILPTHEAMLAESRSLMPPDESESADFHEYRGSRLAERDLPWIDVEKILFLFINRTPGDDVAIALDFRPRLLEPRVVGADWHSDPNAAHVAYREITPTFPAFVELLGL